MASKPFRLFLCRKEVADMAEIDSLEIKIQSDAEKASQAIDKLVKKLDSVAKSLGSINTSTMSASINELTGKLSAINGKGFNNLNKSAKEAETTIKKVSDTAKRGIKSKISFDTKDYQTVIDNLSKKFANAGKGFKTGDTLVQMQKQADTLSARLEKLLQKEDKIVSVGKMSPESSVFQNLQYDINAIMNNLDTLYNKMGQLPKKTKELSNINIHRWNENQAAETLTKPRTVKIPTTSMGYSKEAVAGVEAIYQKMYGDAEKAAQKTDSLGNRVEALKAKLKELSGQGLNFGDAKFDETYKKLNQASEELKKHKNNLEQTGNSGKSFSERLRNALANVSSQTNKTSGNMGKLASSIRNALRSVKQSSDGFGGFAKKIGLLYAKLYVLRRGFNALFGTVKSSMDYIETLNYFNAAFDQIAKKADLKSFKEMGYDSAEAYYNSFSERAEKLTQKMSGFKIDKSGMAVSTGEKSLGIDPGLLMQNQAMFGQMSNSMSIASETAGKLSSVFTRLGGDIASLKNEDFQKVWQNMASGMTGMSRAVDKYGMNIREANLQQTLNNIGIDKSISKLTQQEKVLLRTIVMLDSSRAAWGDLAKTMNQPANQLRLLQSSWSNLSRTIGNIFLPIVAKILPYLNAVTIMLQRFAEQIVRLLGFKDFDWGGLGASGGADFDIDFGDAEDDTAGMADNMDKTAKKAKKAVDNLQGFDIINKLQDPNADKDSNKDKGKGLSPSEVGKLTGALDKLLSDYDKAWNKAFKGMENKANQLANKMQKVLVDAWNKGDFSELGKKVAAWINKGLAKIPWESIKKTVKKIARSIATFLNGFIAELDWVLVGKTFAEGLNTIIEGGYEFWTTFDWLTFGTSLATGVNSFIDNFDAKKFGKLLGAKLRGVIQFAFGFITNLNFEELGEKIGNAINGFFEDMGEVRQNTGLTGWQELGKTISKSVTGILDTINTALSTVKWTEVGKAIGQFIGSINWGEIFVKTGTVIVNALWSAVKIAMSAIAEDPVGIAKAAISILGAAFAYKKLSALISPIKGNIGTILSAAISESKIATAVKELGSIFVGTLKNTIMSSGIAQTIASAFSAVATKMSAVGTMIGTKLMNGAKAVLSNPTTGLVAIAAAAAVGAGLIIADRLKEAIDAVNFTGDYEMKIPEGFTKAAEEAKKALDNTLKGAEETKKTIDGINKSVQTTDGKNIDEMANKYFKLSQKAKPTASDIAVMKKYSSELSDAIPGFAKNVDKQTGAFKGSREELDSLVSSTQRAARAQAAYNASVELYEKQQENKKSIEEKEKVLSKYEKEYEEIKKVTEAVKQQHGVESEIYKAQLRSQGTFASKVNSARAEVDALKKSQKDIGEQIKKNNKIMDNAKVSTENYAKANKTLKDKMNELGVSSKNQKEVIKKLNGLVDEGEISWKDYKKIVDGSYTSVEDLDGAIKGLSPKTVKINVKTEGKDDLKEAEKAANSLPSEKTTIFSGIIGEKFNDAITAFRNNIDEKVPEEKDTKLGIKVNEEEIKKEGAKVAKNLPKDAKVGIKFGIKKEISEKMIKTFDVLSKSGIIGSAAFIGVKEALKTIPTFKYGGYPTAGQLFIANEAGPELVGKMNGRTAVAPQNDIAEGFAVAITNTLAPVMYSAFKQAAIETAQISGGDVYLDGMKVTDNIIGHINQISQSRGRSPIWGVN